MIVKALGAAALSLALLAGAAPAYAISNVDAGVKRDTQAAPPLRHRAHRMHRAHKKPMHHRMAKKPMHHNMDKQPDMKKDAM